MSTGQGFPGAAKVASSAKPGRGPEYALDNSTATWWEPAEDDTNPVLTISLSPAVDRDRVQTFRIDGARLLFGGGARRGFSGAASAAPIYKYKIEVSMDGKDWSTALDQSGNQVPLRPPHDARLAQVQPAEYPGLLRLRPRHRLLPFSGAGSDTEGDEVTEPAGGTGWTRIGFFFVCLYFADPSALV